MAVGGGAPFTIALLAQPRGISWSSDDRIIFADDRSVDGFDDRSGLGGKPQVLTTPGAGEDHVYPFVLPGSKAVLFTVQGLRYADRGGGHRQQEGQPLLGDGNQAAHAPQPAISSTSLAALCTVRSTRRRRAWRRPFPVNRGISTTGAGAANYSVSDSGTCSHPKRSKNDRSLVWVTHDGRRSCAAAKACAFSLCGSHPRAAAWPWTSATRKMTSCPDLIGQTLKARLTFNPGLDTFPVWEPAARHYSKPV